MNPKTAKAYSGTCDRGDHDERRVSIVLRNAAKYNNEPRPMVRCGECGHIVMTEPDANLLSEYMGFDG